MKNSREFKSIAEIKEANKKAGHHFFDEKTMELFQSKIEEKVFNERYFVTSEENYEGTARTFQGRMVTDSGKIESIGPRRDIKIDSVLDCQFHYCGEEYKK